MTTCRMPAAVASVEEVVEEFGPDRHVVDHPIHADVLVVVDVEGRRVKLAAGQPGEDVDADGPHQWLGIRVADQRAIGAGCYRAGSRHHRRSRPHATSQIPRVVMSSRHSHPLSRSCLHLLS
jgi:hypothetical protein